MNRVALLQGIEVAAQRARWTRGLMVALAVVSIACIAVDLSQLEYLGRAQAGQAVEAAEGQEIDANQLVVNWTLIGLSMVAGITWLMWVHRATANLRLAGSGASRFTPGWAVGWYFVPILNLFRVWQVMQDLAGRSAEGNDRPVGPRSESGLVGAWWAMFVFSRCIGRYVDHAIVKAETLSEVSRATRLSVFSDVLGVVSAVLAWVVVRRIDRLQREVLVLAPPVPIAASEAAPAT